DLFEGLFQSSSVLILLCDIHGRAYHLDNLAPWVDDRIADGVDMLHCPIWKNDSKRGIEVCLFANCFFERAIKPGSVAGVNSFQGCVAVRPVFGGIKSKNLIEFRTPIYAIGGRRMDSPGSRMCQPL